MATTNSKLFPNFARHYARSIKFKYGVRSNCVSAENKTSSPPLNQTSTSSNELLFPGIWSTKWTNTLNFIGAESYPTIPVYRIMDTSGTVLDESQMPKLNRELIEKMYKDMVMLSTMDNILYESQRQGRISFYMTNTGEESSQIGSAAALKKEDLIYGQYREAGVLLWRGFTISQFMDQCYSNLGDENKGRQMPVHYGSRDLNFVTISSPLGTQMPQAAGSAYAFKIKKEDKVVCVYFGEGCASEGDSHAAFNFAATLDCPVIFFCRNNGYAISTPAKEQYRGDGIAARGAGYGIKSIRVDGNDIFAVYNATIFARNYALTENKPIILEAMTYRVSHHSTSDDSMAYRSIDEVNKWSENSGIGGPISRLRKWLEKKGWWDTERDQSFKNSAKKQILASFVEAENKLKPSVKEMFTDVYHDIPWNLREQMQEMEEHISMYKEHYPIDLHQ